MKRPISFCFHFLVAVAFGPLAYGSNPGVEVSAMPSVEVLNESTLNPILGAIGNKPIVLLGESIHLASEFSVARRKLIEALSQKSNFRAVYFEGSPVEFWISEDIFLDSEKTSDDFIAFQKAALFFLWQTKEISELVRFALNTQSESGNDWLYLSSYDVQIGQGMAFLQGRPIFKSLISRLTKRGAVLSPAMQDSIIKLEGLARCKAKGFPANASDYELAQRAISELELAIKPIAKSGVNPHVDALSMLPRNLAFSLEFCREAQVQGNNYTSVRDSWAAKQFDWMNTAFPKRSVVWAHSGHTISTPRSEATKNFGYFLRNIRPQEIYSIHFTAIAGKAMSFMDENDNEIDPTEVNLAPAQNFSFESKLSQLAQSDFFLALSSEQKLFSLEEIARIEPSGKMRINPALSYDGYYVIQELHSPRLFEY